MLEFEEQESLRDLEECPVCHKPGQFLPWSASPMVLHPTGIGGTFCALTPDLVSELMGKPSGFTDQGTGEEHHTMRDVMVAMSEVEDEAELDIIAFSIKKIGPAEYFIAGWPRGEHHGSFGTELGAVSLEEALDHLCTTTRREWHSYDPEPPDPKDVH